MSEIFNTLITKSASVFIGIIISLASFFGIENQKTAFFANIDETADKTKKEYFVSNDILKEEILTESLKNKEKKTDENNKKEENNNVSDESINSLNNTIEETQRLILGFSNIYIANTNTSFQKEQEIITPTLPVEEINEKIRPAAVNILCVSKNSGALQPITGSGIVIDPRGIILTNAHVAEYLLLTDSFGNGIVSCSARFKKNSATYHIEPLFISELWVVENQLVILENNPKGTGQYDYALLAITSPVSSQEEKKETFEYVEMETNLSQLGKENYVLLASFPAELLGGITIQKDISLVSSVGEIIDTMTFDKESSKNLDAIAIDGNIVSQKGSSGGAVISLETGKLIGIISVSSSGETTKERSLLAITTHHINRSLMKETGTDFSNIAHLNIQEQIKVFRETNGATLHNILVDLLK